MILSKAFFSDSEEVESRKTEALRLKTAVAALEEKHFSRAAELFGSILAENLSLKAEVLVHYIQALLEQASKLVRSDTEKAEKLLLKAVQLDPENIEGLFQLGLFYVAQEDYGKAIVQYNKVAELNPRYPNTFYNLGYIYAKIKNYPKAEEMFERTVALAPPFIDEALFNLAVVQEKLGKFEKCITRLEQAIEANPNNKPAKKFLKRLKRK